MTYYIYSTHTNPVQYVEYDTNSMRNHNVIKRRFLVAGGHGLCNKNLITPQGVITVVSREEDMQWLESLDSFKSDKEKGFIRVMKRKEEPEKVVNRDMNKRDGSAPKTPNDYKVRDKDTYSYSVSNAM